MEIEEVIKKVINILDKLNIPYLLTGALSVVYYGEPRAAYNINLSNIDKHYYDAFSVYCIQKDNLDIEYIKNWCKAKSILEIFERMVEEIKKES